MKQIIAYALVIAASVLIADYAVAATSGTPNSQGAAGAALTVGTSSTKVIPFVAGRSDVYIFNAVANTLYCMPGPTGGGAPSPAPTSAGANAGIVIAAGGSFHASVNGGFTPAGVGLVAQAEIDCACSAASCTVNTWELP